MNENTIKACVLEIGLELIKLPKSTWKQRRYYNKVMWRLIQLKKVLGIDI